MATVHLLATLGYYVTWLGIFREVMRLDMTNRPHLAG